MSAGTIEIDDRTDVDFIIKGQAFNVCIRDNKLQVRADGQIIVMPGAANAIDIDVMQYGKLATAKH